ncbi:ion channel [uncultured Methanobrevibacter sp.]|uniref:ion channel n=1 Tax=uncultured Methanobrevibacter sp. TaxID=253161 RepID=UPI0026063508|nr:ion channel [uncultured Methanobrevibacter sp.]
MKVLGMDLNWKLFINLFVINGLIVTDIILITIEMIFQVPEIITLRILNFDFIVCIILLIEWTTTFIISPSKKTFLKDRDNILALIASIPFDSILPVIIPGMNLLRYLRLLKLIRIVFLFERFSYTVKKFVNKTNIDKILGGVIITILIFTGLLYIFGPSYGIFDDFYFVIVTLTTVGYGDITPQTYNEKVITMMLITAGIFIFSTITAAISSFMTERLIESDEDEFEAEIREHFESMNSKLDSLGEENRMLREEIKELKEKMEE